MLLLPVCAWASIPTGEDDGAVLAGDGGNFDWFGGAVSKAGDADGDGFDDVVVGAYGDDDSGSPAGTAYLFYGGPDGLSSKAQRKIDAASTTSGAWFGLVQSDAGDVNGDGHPDLVFGTPNDSGAGSYAGAAFVYYGDGVGFDSAGSERVDPSAAGRSAFFGYAVAMAGDVDGDGYADFAAGSSYMQSTGAAWLYYGSAGGVDFAREQALLPDDLTSTSAFAYALGGGDDLDGDGFPDLAGGAWGDGEAGSLAGAVYVWYGASGGADPASLQKVLASDAAAGDALGSTVAFPGDLDGDGYGELAATAYSGDGAHVDTGAVYVWYGSAAGVDPARELRVTASDGATSDQFGYHVTGLGDADGDGFDDLAISAHYDASLEGSLYVYFGGATGLDMARETRLFGTGYASAGDQLGFGLAGVGDVDGDGRGDLVAGAPLDDASGTDAGVAYWFRGGRDGDGDGVLEADDCDDADPAVDGPDRVYDDADGDTHGDPATAHEACEGGVSVGDDCDDADSAVHPGAPDDPTDGVDSDCDGAAEDPPDTGDTAPVDTGPPDTGPSDTGSSDTSAPDTDGSGDSETAGDPLPEDSVGGDTAKGAPSECGCAAGAPPPAAPPASAAVGLATLVGLVALRRRRPGQERGARRG